MEGLTFEQPIEKETFERYLSHLEDLTSRIKRMEKRIEEVAQGPEYREQAQRPRAFRGIDYLTALALLCEIGDFKKFPSAGAFMSYLGLVPSEFSSGQRRNQGRITKAGLSPMNRVSYGNQPANISLTDRRGKFPCSFRYLALFFRHLLL